LHQPPAAGGSKRSENDQDYWTQYQQGSSITPRGEAPLLTVNDDDDPGSLNALDFTSPRWTRVRKVVLPIKERVESRARSFT